MPPGALAYKMALAFGGLVLLTVMNIRGVKDLEVEQVGGEQHLEMQLNRSELARYGLNVSDVFEAAKIGVFNSGGNPSIQNTGAA